MIIWYIHGAGATERSFAWLRHQFPEHEARFFTYPVSEPVVSSVTRLADMIAEDARACVLIGHSLGGILATAAASLPIVQRVVSICSPFGGVKHADLLAMFNYEPLVQDMRAYGPVLRSVRSARNAKPHLAIIGTRGLPFLDEANDGAVTVASQTAMPDLQYQRVALNHFEVLLSEDVAEMIVDFMFPVSN